MLNLPAFVSNTVGSSLCEIFEYASNCPDLYSHLICYGVDFYFHMKWFWLVSTQICKYTQWMIIGSLTKQTFLYFVLLPCLVWCLITTHVTDKMFVKDEDPKPSKFPNINMMHLNDEICTYKIASCNASCTICLFFIRCTQILIHAKSEIISNILQKRGKNSLPVPEWYHLKLHE